MTLARELQELAKTLTVHTRKHARQVHADHRPDIADVSLDRDGTIVLTMQGDGHRLDEGAVMWGLVQPGDLSDGDQVAVIAVDNDYIVVTTITQTSGRGTTKTIGNGAATSFDITHGFGTRDVHVTVYRLSTPWANITNAVVERPDIDTVRVSTPTETLGVNAARVLVTRAA